MPENEWQIATGFVDQGRDAVLQKLLFTGLPDSFRIPDEDREWIDRQSIDNEVLLTRQSETFALILAWERKNTCQASLYGE